MEAGKEFVITRNGKPFALLVHTEPQAVEERLRALRFSWMAELVAATQAEAKANGTSELTEADVQAEIDAARAEGRAHLSASSASSTEVPPVAAEPKPQRYARRR